LRKLRIQYGHIKISKFTREFEMRNLIIASLVAFFSSSALGETRCGWIENPTPGNFWLTDKDGEWTIGVQGGFQAEGIEVIEFPADAQYVNVNGNYGYFCGCITGQSDSETMRILSISKSKAKLLKDCLKDENVPKPK
jgi:hypothetical protein